MQTNVIEPVFKTFLHYIKTVLTTSFKVDRWCSLKMPISDMNISEIEAKCAFEPRDLVAAMWAFTMWMAEVLPLNLPWFAMSLDIHKPCLFLRFQQVWHFGKCNGLEYSMASPWLVCPDGIFSEMMCEGLASLFFQACFNKVLAYKSANRMPCMQQTVCLHFIFSPREDL